jgi:hypothetical protein
MEGTRAAVSQPPMYWERHGRIHTARSEWTLRVTGEVCLGESPLISEGQITKRKTFRDSISQRGVWYFAIPESVW